MKKLKYRMKKISPKNRSVLKITSVIVLIALITTIVSAAVSNHETVLPDNPIQEEVSDVSDVRLMDVYKDFIDEQEHPSESEEDNEDLDQEDQDKEKDKEKEDMDDANGEERNEQGDIASDQQGDSGIDSGGNGNASEGDEGEPTSDSHTAYSEDLEITDKDTPDKNEYFTTSIEDQEIVTDTDFTFTISQLEHDFDVKDVHVSAESVGTIIESITGEQEELLNVDAQLAEGENYFRVSVAYEDSDAATFTVTQGYLVILKEDDIVIHTDLEDREVHDENLSFTASAQRAGESVPVTVKVNGEKVSSDDNQYEATLVEGDNDIVITAQDAEEKVTKEFIIHYQQPSLSFQTDLEDQTVENPDFSFSAKAFNGDEEIDISVLHNDERIDPSNDGNYSVTLQENENTIELYAEKGNQSHSETYAIQYANNLPEDSNENDDDEHAPTIEIHDIKEGQTLKGKIKTFHVSAKDYSGESVSSKATNNGVGLETSWTDNQTSFILEVQDGENNIVVTATDSEGNTAKKSLTVYGDISDGVVGHATISVEATTVGLGHIIPAEEVEIHQGDNGADVIDRLFEKHGIQYEYTGSHEHSFYLEAMYRSGLVNNPSIPSDLLELLERDFDRADPDDYNPDDLGEFDFTSGSGWMYSVNGNYPNVGFADYYFEEGDVVRIRFTLAYGADIGGGMPGTNYGKEW